jgi:Asp-tRNA(Asn)/Glu-tRNA(Gln) amidotransferase B subunit
MNKYENRINELKEEIKDRKETEKSLSEMVIEHVDKENKIREIVNNKKLSNLQKTMQVKSIVGYDIEPNKKMVI